MENPKVATYWFLGQAKQIIVFGNSKYANTR